MKIEYKLIEAWAENFQKAIDIYQAEGWRVHTFNLIKYDDLKGGFYSALLERAVQEEKSGEGPYSYEAMAMKG